MASVPIMMPRLRPGTAQLRRIDRLGWSAGTCFDAYGLRVGVRTNAPGLLEHLSPHLPPGWRASASPLVDQIFSLWVDPGGTHRPSRVYAGRRRRARTADLAQALAVLESEIRQCVAAGAERRTFVHAGVVGWRGRAILIPGRSRSGKTTLVAELVKAGASYLSDEFAVLDGRGRAHPFAKPLSIRGASGCDRHARAQRAEELGGSCATAPLPVRLVVLTEHRPATPWRPERLTAGQAVLELLAHTVPARLRPEASLLSLERAVARAVVLKGPRGEARDLARTLLRSVVDDEPASRRPAGERDAMRPVARRDGVLIRELPGELLVYERDEHRAHCLNRTAAIVFQNADGTRTAADLGRLLAPQVDAAESEAVVREALAHLADAGLLDGAPVGPGLSRREVVRRVGIGAAILLPAVASIVVPTPAEAAATCVTSCAGKPDSTPCTCFGASPCTASCVTGLCSDGGGC